MRSYTGEYELVIAHDVPAALELLACGEEWRPIAGGTDLMVLFNAGKLSYRNLVSIRRIAELRAIESDESSVLIGAAATYTQIRASEILQGEFPLLVKAASWTGGIANQNRGTLGGNIANASPAADSAPPLLVYDAEIELQSQLGVRSIPYRDFHSSYKRMMMQPDELISRIRLPRRRWTREYSRKVGARKAQAIAKVCVAAAATLEDGRMHDVRIAFGSVAPIPLRCLRTEECLRGQALGRETIDIAKETLRSEIQPISDIRSTSDYRLQVAQNLLQEFLLGLE
ncbi:MAG TPA: xanthine dehydrogenase family protein subunit M [Bryobacteraceae bacterium]|nr:xanthine dehydrogenase family protein subunit M [Bryobacteraceae bacterium]